MSIKWGNRGSHYLSVISNNQPKIRKTVFQVKNAQLAGARGIILYSDPADYFAPGVEAYPDGWNLPGGGVQRGNILNLNGAGDPLTPGYPANGE